MVETAAPKHGGLDLCLGIAWHLEDLERTLTPKSHKHHAFTDMTGMVAMVVHHGRIKRLSLNFSPFGARKTWLRSVLSPRRLRANRVKKGVPL